MILLAPDACALFAPPGTADSHGWASGPDQSDPYWSGPGNLQLGLGTAGVDAAGQGGHGPFGPASTAEGVVYLPPECGAVDGDVLTARDRSFVLSLTRTVPDPTGGPIGCAVANVTEVEPWLVPQLSP